MQLAILFISLVILITLSVPIGISLGLSTLLTLIFSTNIPSMIIAQNAFTALDSFPLMAIPFFILAGNFMRYGGISKRLLDFADSLIGFVTGGLAMVTTLACMFFAAISGSGPATVSAIGSFMIPAMKEKKYKKGYATAITAAAGTIGVVIPPSIPFVIYGVVTGVSIGDLFVAGIIPGILMGAGLMMANYMISKKYGFVGNQGKPSFQKIIRSFKKSFFALLVPIIILGGIYGGIFTPTEAAAVGAVYAFIVGKFIYKELGRKEIYDCLKDTVLINGATTFMIGLSMSFASLLTMEQLPNTIANQLIELSSNKVIIFLIINLFLLVIGCFIDNISSCIILAPIFLPVVTKLGMSPIQFGIVMTINLAIGFVTPPYGANLFIASAVGEVSMEEVAKYIWPLIFTLIFILLLVTFVPSLSLIFL